MKYAPWAAAAIFAVVLAAALRPEPRPDGFEIPEAGRLPILHNGRFKPLDTVARTTLLMLRGKQSFPEDGRTVRPMEWLLDVLARPEQADGKPVFLVQDPDLLTFLGRESPKKNYFSFRELAPFLDALDSQAREARKLEAPERSLFQTAALNLSDRLMLYQRLRYTLLPPETEDFSAELEAYRGVLPAGLTALARHETGRFDREALAALGRFVHRFEFTSRMAVFFPFPPAEGKPDEEWRNAGQALLTPLRGGPIPEELADYATLLDARRLGKAGAFNAAAARLQESFSKKAPAVSSRALAETVFNRLEPFYWGMVLYAAAFLLAVLSWLAAPLRRSALWLAAFAFAVHTAGLAARIALQGRPPVTNLYSSAVFVGWGAVLFGILLERASRRGFGVTAASAIGFATLIIAHHLAGQGDTMEMMRAVLDSNFWLATHVTTITVGYSATFLAGALAHVYIFRGLFSRTFSEDQRRALSRMVYGVVCFALLFSFTGTVLGGIWADQSWGRFWGWDPKENGALLIFLWNALILHALLGKFAGERGLMVMAVFGNIITSLSWFGVNMLGVGLHSYGFMDKAFWSLSAFVASQLAVMLLGLFARFPAPPRVARSTHK
jgi:ABC-type transport system involved in cytochrome c biogenesis permease subunit